MSILLSVPDDISRDILANWIEVGELGLLDRSLCCKQRGSFLEAMKCLTGIHSRKVNSSFQLSYYRWIHHRGIKLGSLILSRKSSVESMINIDNEHIQEIEFWTNVEISEGFNDFIRSCKSLQTLRFCSMKWISKLEPTVFQSLKYLTVESGQVDNSFLVQTIHDNCRQLRLLAISHDLTDCTIFPNILTLNPHLEEVRLRCTQSLLYTLSAFQQLKSINLNSPYPVELQSIRDCFLARNNLEFLYVWSNWNSFQFDNKQDNGKVVCHSWSWSDSDLLNLFPVVPRFKTLCFRIYSDKFSVDVVPSFKHCADTLTRIDLGPQSLEVIDAMLHMLPKIDDLTLNYSSDAFPLLQVHGQRLLHLRINAEECLLSTLSSYVEVCPNLIELTCTVNRHLTFASLDSAQTFASSVSHISRLTLETAACGFKFAFGKLVHR